MQTRTALPLLALATAFGLAACDREREAPAPEPTASEEPESTRSIIRPVEGEPEATVDEVLEPLQVVVQFPESGFEIPPAGIEKLRTAIRSAQFEAGGPIVIGGHSDAGGNDAINLRVSRQRAEAVRDWLLENGVAEGRMEVIAFGEQNPLRPNALPNGQPDPRGRAANRRAEVTIGEPVEELELSETDGPATLVEKLAGDGQQDAAPEAEATSDRPATRPTE
ncbi:OmpA family protein [Qipengyuania sp. JC766]|uniref:OmpA family protein n=1 Tax=Qipengyuania sp. JC766 TaxID=3232139 RepID=UPI00345A1260